jgi:hypothetical protein
MPSFKVPCPSCEYQVTIKDPKLIGTKVECPKCKYRFKAEEPAGGIPKEDGAPKGKKANAKEADATKKKKSKKIVAVVVGVLALVILAIVGISVLPGKKDPQIGSIGPGGPKGKMQGGTNDSTDPKDDPEKKETTPGKPKVTIPRSNKETTNLLPNGTVSLFRFDVRKLLQTPASLLSDTLTLEMFRASFGFELDKVAVYYHAFVGNTRDPFGLIRLKEPIDAKEILTRMPLAAETKSIKGHTLHAFRTNPFINGVTNACSMSSLFADIYAHTPPGNAPVPASRIIGICIYDSEHILVGDHAQLAAFLGELDDKGYPKFQSVHGDAAKGAKGPYAQNPLYLSIDPRLKSLLKELDSEGQDPPMVLHAENVIQGLYDPKFFKQDFQPIAAVLDPVLRRTQLIGASLLSFSSRQINGNLKLVMTSDTAAIETVKEQLDPALIVATQSMALFLGSPVDYRNLTSTGSGATSPGGTSGPMGPMGPMGPTYPKPPMPTTPPGPRPGVPPGPPMGPNMRPPGTTTPVYPPGMTPPGVGPMGPMGPMGTEPANPELPLSHISLGMTDQTISLAIDLNWTDDAYLRKIGPPMVGFINVIKGKMAVYASDLSYHVLAVAVPKMTGETKMFPRGTFDRKIMDADRRGFKYPPDTRVSFFAELLPFMGRVGLAANIDKNLAWFDEKNLPAAEAWVPELLVPSYPQSAWRATSPHVPEGRVLGGTNYVAIAGIGLDVARYGPGHPKFDPKKAGLVGYDWGSNLQTEVPDGTSNTIYLMQTPPGLSQPWMAGGGATVRGLNEKDPMHGFRHTYTQNSQPGTYALMGDGGVRFVSGNINPKVLLAMSTRAGGEAIADVIEMEAPRINPARVPNVIDIKTDPVEKPAEPKVAEKKLAPPKTPVEPLPGPKGEAAPMPREKK